MTQTSVSIAGQQQEHATPWHGALFHEISKVEDSNLNL